MALDLGRIGFTIEADTSDFDKKLSKVETDARALDKAFSQLGKQKISPTVDTQGIDKAKGQVDKAKQSMEQLGRSKASLAADAAQVTRAKGELDKATDAARTLSSTRIIVKPEGVDEIARAAKEMNGLEQATGRAKSVMGTLGKVTGGLATVGGAATALGMGMNRLNSIEGAEASLRGLGHEASSVDRIMSSALASVKGTAFGLGDAAQIAASAVAAGVEPGKDLERTLKLTGDAATIAKAELGEMGSIINKVATSDMMQMDVANQLMDAGIPILTLVAEQMGVTAGEARDLASEGKVSFEIFQNALESGLGGAALEAGNTFTGSMNNLRAAVGRTAAAFLEGGFSEAPEILAKITEGVDKLTPAAEAAGTAMVEGIGTGVDIAKDAVSAWQALPEPVRDLAQALLVAKAAQIALNKAAGTETFSKATKAISTASEASRNVATQLQGVYNTTRATNPAVGKLGASLAVLGGRGGMATVAMGGLKKGLSGLLGVLGGGWGVATMAALTAITTIIQNVRKVGEANRTVAESTREAEQATAEFYAAQAKQQGGLTEAGKAAAAKVVEGYTAGMLEYGEANKGLFNTATLYDPADFEPPEGLNPRYFKNWENEVSKITTDASDKVREAAESMGISMDDLNAVIAEGGAEYQTLLGLVSDGTAGGDYAASKLEAARGQIEAMAETARTADPTMADLGAAIGVLADESSSADDQLSALHSALQALGLAPKDATDAMMQAAEAVDEVIEAAVGAQFPLEQLGDNLFNNGSFADGLDTSNKAAQALHEQLSTLGEELVNVANNGGDVDATWQDMQPALEEIGTAFNLTKEQVLELGRAYSLAPNELEMLVNLKGADKATEELGMIALAHERLAEGEPVKFQVETEAAQDALRSLGVSLDEVDGQEGWFMVTADTEEAQENLREVGDIITAFEGNLSIETAMDTSPVVSGHSEVNALLDDLAAKVTEPSARLRIDELRGSKSIAVNEILQLAAMTADPKAILEAARAIGDARTLNSLLRQLDGKQTSSKHVHQEITERIIMQSSRDSGGRGRQVAYAGMRLPMYADGDRHEGYRLPTTGAGTHVRDGFLALDYTGVPIARVDKGEWIINGKASSKWDGLLDSINRDDEQSMVAYLLDGLSRYETGGKAKSSAAIKSALSSMNGTSYIMGGWSAAGTDCSGAVSMGVNAGEGLSIFDSRMNTQVQGAWLQAKGWVSGRGTPGKDHTTGWYDYGGGASGHTSMQLADGTNIESGGNTGGGLTIGGRAGGLDGRGYQHFMHKPADEEGSGEGEFLTGDDGARVSMGTTVSMPSAEHASAETGLGSSFNRTRIQSSATGKTYGGTGGMSAGAVASSMGMGGAIRQARAQAAGNPKAEAMLDQLLNMDASNVDILLRMDDQTINAFNNLGEAEAKLINSAMSITEAEEALAEARKDAAENGDDNAKALADQQAKVAEAEKDLAKARAEGKPEQIEQAEKRLKEAREKLAEDTAKAPDAAKNAAKKVQSAEENLIKARKQQTDAAREAAQAAKEYEAAAASAPLRQLASLEDTAMSMLDSAAAMDKRVAVAKAALELLEVVTDSIGASVTGAFEGVAKGAETLTSTMQRLGEALEIVQQLESDRLESEMSAVQASRSVLEARQAVRDAEREHAYRGAEDARAVQQAEFNLAQARYEASQVAGAAEVDLAEVREKGIFDVAQLATAGNQAALLAAVEVATAEAQLADVRAQADFNTVQNMNNVIDTSVSLERAQYLAEFEMRRLTAATEALAKAQASAAGEIGGQGALQKYLEGMQMVAEADAAKAGGISKAASIWNILPWNWGEIAEGVQETRDAEQLRIKGEAQAKAYEAQAMEELNKLDESVQETVTDAIAQIAGDGTVGDKFADFGVGLMGFLSGDARLMSAHKQAQIWDVLKPVFEIVEASLAEIEAEAYKAEKQQLALETEKQRTELEWARMDLERDAGRYDETNYLRDMLEETKRIRGEHEQENAQLEQVNRNLEGRNQSVLMSLGGSGWGTGGTATELVNTAGGFGGITTAGADQWASLGVEDGWSSLTKALPVGWSRWADEEASSLGGYMDLPNTVVDGHHTPLDGVDAYKRFAGADTVTRGELLDAIKAVVGGSGTQIGTQFNGDVQLTNQQAEGLLDGLLVELSRG